MKTNQYANALRFFNFFHAKTEINTVATKIKSPIKTPPPPDRTGTHMLSDHIRFLTSASDGVRSRPDESTDSAAACLGAGAAQPYYVLGALWLQIFENFKVKV